MMSHGGRGKQFSASISKGVSKRANKITERGGRVQPCVTSFINGSMQGLYSQITVRIADSVLTSLSSELTTLQLINLVLSFG